MILESQPCQKKKNDVGINAPSIFLDNCHSKDSYFLFVSNAFRANFQMTSVVYMRRLTGIYVCCLQKLLITDLILKMLSKIIADNILILFHYFSGK